MKLLNNMDIQKLWKTVITVTVSCAHYMRCSRMVFEVTEGNETECG
jgi:hypothetical protein